MRIEGEALTVRGLFRSGRFRPARVQREYRWDEEQQMRLLLDLEHAFVASGLDPDPLVITSDEAPAPPDALDLEELAVADWFSTPEPRTRPAPTSPAASPRSVTGYFLGPMILQRSDRADDLRFVYDGQQRLTTLALLLAVFRDVLPDGPVLAGVLDCLLLPTGAPRLEAPTPGGALSRITSARGRAHYSNRANQSAADGRLFEGVARLRRLPEQWSSERLGAFVRFLLDEVWVTVTYIDDRRLAEMAYVTVNTRGLRLDSSDVLKGHLVQVVSEVSLTRGQALAEAWDRLRREADHHFEPLLRAVDFGLFGKVRTHDFGAELIEVFPDGGASAAAKIEEWVSTDLVAFWNAFSRVVREPAAYDVLDGATLALRRLSFLDWTEWHAVAIAMVERWEGDELARGLTLLQRACYVVHLLGWSFVPERRARVLHRAFLELEDQLSPFRPSPQGRATTPGPLHFFEESRTEARSALVGPMTERQTFGPIVRLAETLLWEEAGREVPGLAGQGVVDHVLPRIHDDDWLRGFPTDHDVVRSKHLLGNLCLVPGELEEVLRTLSFPDKRGRLQALAPNWRSAHEVVEHELWTVGIVETRTARLAGLVAAQLGVGPR